jgi:hypothetical protein
MPPNSSTLCNIPTVATISAGGAPFVGGKTDQQAPKLLQIFTKKRVAPFLFLSSLKFTARKLLFFRKLLRLKCGLGTEKCGLGTEKCGLGTKLRVYKCGMRK